MGLIREGALHLPARPKNKAGGAFHISYKVGILALAGSLRSPFAGGKNLPRTDKPIPIVLSGGTAKPKGFLEKFRQTIERDKFPLEISEIRMAEDPLTATARGCLIAAMYDA